MNLVAQHILMNLKFVQRQFDSKELNKLTDYVKLKRIKIVFSSQQVSTILVKEH